MTSWPSGSPATSPAAAPHSNVAPSTPNCRTFRARSPHRRPVHPVLENACDMVHSMGEVDPTQRGDSRVYLARNGEATQLTEDHTWLNVQVQHGRLTPAEARLKGNASQHIITPSVGLREYIEVDIPRRARGAWRPPAALLRRPPCLPGLEGHARRPVQAQHPRGRADGDPPRQRLRRRGQHRRAVRGFSRLIITALRRPTISTAPTSKNASAPRSSPIPNRCCWAPSSTSARPPRLRAYTRVLEAFLDPDVPCCRPCSHGPRSPCTRRWPTTPRLRA